MAAQLTIDDVTLFQILVVAIPRNMKQDLFISPIALCNAVDGVTKPTPSSICVVEVNALFFTSEDLVQNVLLKLIFEPIRVDLNTSVFLCLDLAHAASSD
ncbi:hypothetical protein HNY73_003303 [Argiope bruennichi]|uniref:Uncharacterized protein n=1 Tax=Argiope bruennichi TaxID=94029 RepID=A0A8T0FZ32_ARGBR|nr:hypothetical protein HNY73_003303 [Argiope bruennichi]